MNMNLSVKDKRILYELEQDCRQGWSSIAKKIGMSKQVVRYRVNALEQKKVISQYMMIIDTQRLGYQFFTVFFQLKNATKKREQELVQFLCKLDETNWVTSAAGKWNVLASFMVNNIVKFHECLERLHDMFQDVLDEKSFSIVVEGMPCKKKYLFDTDDLDGKQLFFGRQDSVRLDSHDVRILHVLSENPIMPLQHIASKTKLSFETIKARMKNLRDVGIIQAFTIKLNPGMYGYEWYYVLLKLDKCSVDQRKKLQHILRSHPNVVFLATMIGNENLVMDVHVKNVEELQELLHAVQEQSGHVIKGYDSMHILQEHKCSYFPPSLMQKTLNLLPVLQTT